MPTRELRVLLMSPLPDVDPFCGDVVYTQGLLEQPPPGVTYVRYDEALASGELHEHGRRRNLEATGTWSTRLADHVCVVREHALNRTRDHGLLFREPFRFLEVRGAFHLVHNHTYSVRWTGVPTPVVVSSALPLTELYARARGWPDKRVRAADRVVTFTHALRRWYIDRGVPEERIGVVPCFPPAMPSGAVAAPVPGRVGFVAGDFLAKGGDTVLEAMAEVRRHRPDAHLWIAGGSIPSTDRELAGAGAAVQGYLSRAELLADFLPSCQVFAYPSRFDGLTLTLLEALGSGVPAVVSDYFALPEVVADGASGRVVPRGDPAAVAAALLDLLAAAVVPVAAQAARARYASTYSPAAVLPQLRAEYDRAIRGRRGRPV
jgi:glycosyltransferase involved in cell wall biosynthesis